MGMNIDIFTYMNMDTVLCMGVKKGTVTYQGTDLGSGHE
jgi:hypothetical protein